MTDPINLDRLEEELTRISPWPWELTDSDNRSDEDWLFIAKAPSTIAALVKRVREQDAIISHFEQSEHWTNYIMEEQLKRGSDEV